MPLPASLGFKVVASAGTPVRLSSAPLTVASVRLQPLSAPGVENVGNVYIGTQNMNKTTGAGVYAILSPEQVEGFQFLGYVDLGQLWIDADNNGDGCLAGYSIPN